jgi:hypothetical protein
MPRVNWKLLVRLSKSSNFIQTNKTSQVLGACEVFAVRIICNSDGLWYIKKTEDV